MINTFLLRLPNNDILFKINKRIPNSNIIYSLRLPSIVANCEDPQAIRALRFSNPSEAPLFGSYR
jgi:hypothetical protein